MGMAIHSTLLYEGGPDIASDAPQPRKMTAADDVTLVASARTGDMQAFEELVRRYRNDVYGLSYHFLRNREEAWDSSQEVFIKAHRSLKKFRGEASFKTWLLRITSNHCKDVLKKKRLRTVPLEDLALGDAASGDAGPRSQLQAEEIGAAIESALGELSVKHRTAFILREFEGLSYQEMAEVMNCNMGTVMSRLHHARKNLQRLLVGAGVVEGANDES